MVVVVVVVVVPMVLLALVQARPCHLPAAGVVRSLFQT